MLTVHPEQETGGGLHPGAVWIDLFQASEADRALVTEVTGLKIPTQDQLSEIETSSRLQSRHGVLTMSLPIVVRSPEGPPQTTPVGFVLTRERLVTVRYAPIPTFDAVRRDATPEQSAAALFVTLCEAIVDHIADVLERLGGELDRVSQTIFHDPAELIRRPARADARLRGILREVGRTGDLASRLREALLGVGRMLPYVAAAAADWLPAELKPRLKTLQRDIAALDDYDTSLYEKVQFLLDATLGFINIEQSVIIKVLTIVSVVGIPPTLVASIYGMNFKNMPELQWNWGYEYGLGVIALSAVGTLLWFKLRGWL